MDNHGNFNRLLTRDFTLVWARMAGRSDPKNEAEISLITQRSQVQILSPLRKSGLVKRGFRRFSEAASRLPWAAVGNL